MSFQSLNHILVCLQEQSRWQDQPFQRVLKCWSETVGTVVAAHTCPTSIQKQVLWVATSSAVWAQELSFGRQRILQKLNAQLSPPLQDIRFSSAQWQRHQNHQSNSDKQPKIDIGRSHPSWIVDFQGDQSAQPPHAQTANDAFQDWARLMQARSRHLPLCPQCHTPTPPGELQRWAMCSICATKQW